MIPASELHLGTIQGEGCKFILARDDLHNR